MSVGLHSQTEAPLWGATPRATLLAISILGRDSKNKNNKLKQKQELREMSTVKVNSQIHEILAGYLRAITKKNEFP